MSFVVKEEGGNFTPCPAGLHPAVCVDVVDLGHLPDKFNEGKKVHKLRLVWQTADEDENTGKPFQVSSMYTVSLHEKSTLRKTLEGWRGRAFTADELKGFDLELLLGAPCQLNVIQETKANGKVYANIQTIVPMGKGMVKPVARDYVRVKDRTPADEAAAAPSAVAANDDDADNCPF